MIWIQDGIGFPLWLGIAIGGMAVVIIIMMFLAWWAERPSKFGD